MARFIMILFLFVLYIEDVHAELKLEKRDGAVFIDESSTADVENLFRQNNFEEYNIPYGKYPRIYLKKMPSDWKKVEENKAKHRTFIRILLPLVLKVNEAISAERMLIENIKDKSDNHIALNENDLKILEEKAAKYDVFTRMTGKERADILIRELLKRVDTLPPSIMIASAAAYTDWGMSRLTSEANSLYLEEVWYSDEGLKPLDDKDADYRYRVFDSLEESITSHALKMNSSINYEYLWAGRAMGRQINSPPYGEQLAVHLMYDNNMRNIIGLIDYTLTHYGLAKTDYFPQLRNVE